MGSNVWPKGINTQFIHKSHWSIGIESILPFNIGDIFNGVWSVSPEGFVFKGVKGFLLLVKLHLESDDHHRDDIDIDDIDDHRNDIDDDIF